MPGLTVLRGKERLNDSSEQFGCSSFRSCRKVSLYKEINRHFNHYIEDRYHQRIHGTTGQKPIDRYLNDAKALRKAPDDLPEYFRKREERTVNNDRTVKLDGRLFEVPTGLVGTRVVLRFENYDRIEVFVGDESKGFLKDLNQEVNSRVKRKSETPAAAQAAAGGKLFERINDGGTL